ncbi:MAG: hypothetical protein JXJ04_02000, partial [Spirochaetales bacterium]|nr:hypothetical protein [Spirochaetales bacterium]
MGSTQKIYLGLNPVAQKKGHVRGDFIFLDDDLYYKIENVREMDEFFITLVSDADHWMFISSKGALTAGRINPDQALFPYDTVDRIYAYKNRTGVKTALRVTKEDKTFLWEPWSDISGKIYDITGNIYKHTTGCELIFEEINHTLGLSVSYSWSFGRNYGFIKKNKISNLLHQPVSITLADGFTNMMSPGITRQILTSFSCLTDAYKYNVVHPCGLAAYNLASGITDKAEPEESLRATICWNAGLNNSHISLSSEAFHSFCNGKETPDSSILKGHQNDYIVTASFLLSGKETKSWYLIADVSLSQVRVEDLIDNVITSPQVLRSIERERKNTCDNLQKIIGRSDGLQLTEDKRFCSHHYANTLFNVMRGGIIHGDKINLDNFLSYLKARNTFLYKKYLDKFTPLDPEIPREDLLCVMEKEKDPSLKRHILEYLPLRFSRRHGDPSRPWNNFSINTEDKDGRPVLHYEGNWRDIFQNWEALGLSFPLYYRHFIAKFLNAITMDGYNPYRITQNGFEWEKIEPGNPWSNIGYWKDHQIIYVQKFFEWQEIFFPGSLIRDMTEELYSYAHIPYRIRAYEKMLENPRSTIDFDDALDNSIKQRTKTLGTDAALVHDQEGNIYHASLIEKVLILFLAKLSSFVPDGGIWLNTQRPEWNDANNALAGYGLSMVTLYYVRRFTYFWLNLWDNCTINEITLSREIITYAENIYLLLTQFSLQLENKFDPGSRKAFMDGAGNVATAYCQIV